jgi:hypothetical protein
MLQGSGMCWQSLILASQHGNAQCITQQAHKSEATKVSFHRVKQTGKQRAYSTRPATAPLC